MELVNETRCNIVFVEDVAQLGMVQAKALETRLSSIPAGGGAVFASFHARQCFTVH
jgi:hypothetical protein